MWREGSKLWSFWLESFCSNSSQVQSRHSAALSSLRPVTWEQCPWVRITPPSQTSRPPSAVSFPCLQGQLWCSRRCLNPNHDTQWDCDLRSLACFPSLRFFNYKWGWHLYLVAWLWWWSSVAGCRVCCVICCVLSAARTMMNSVLPWSCVLVMLFLESEWEGQILGKRLKAQSKFWILLKDC